MGIPTFEEFAEGTQPAEDESVEPGLSRHGWQKTVHMCFEKKHFQERLWPTLNNTRAMSRSQRGPLAATPFVSSPLTRINTPLFRALLLRRLHIPLVRPRASADVAVHLTHVATIVQLAPGLECWGGVRALWSLLQPGSAGRPGA